MSQERESSPSSLSPSNNNKLAEIEMQVHKEYGAKDHHYDGHGDYSGDSNENSDEDNFEDLEQKLHNNNNNKDDDSSATTTPWAVKRKALAIYILIATSAISQTLIEPILPFMVEERMGISSKNSSLVVGIISSALFFGECLSMAPIGYLSDIYGRKWFMVALQIASFLGVACFGLIETWWIAALLRFAQGCAGGIHATSKAALTDISSEHNRSLLLAYIATTYAIARAFSSLFGVSLVTLMKHHGNPYEITSLIAAGICFTGIIVALFLQETNKNVKSRGLESRTRSLNNISANRRSFIAQYFIDFMAGIKSIYTNRTMLIVTILFCISYFSNSASITLWTIISEASLPEYGLGFSALGTGIYIGIFGITCVIFQLIVYKPGMKKLGLHKMFLIASVCAAVDMTMFSLAPFPYWLNGFRKTWWATSFVVFILCGNAILASASRTILIPTLNGMIGNLTDLRKQGLVQGSIQTLGNFSKAFGPILGGTIHSWSHRISFPWLMPLLVSFMYIICFCVGLFCLNSEEVQQKNPTSGLAATSTQVETDSEEELHLSSSDHEEEHVSEYDDAAEGSKTRTVSSGLA